MFRRCCCLWREGGGGAVRVMCGVWVNQDCATAHLRMLQQFCGAAPGNTASVANGIVL